MIATSFFFPTLLPAVVNAPCGAFLCALASLPPSRSRNGDQDRGRRRDHARLQLAGGNRIWHLRAHRRLSPAFVGNLRAKGVLGSKIELVNDRWTNPTGIQLRPA